jgi:hypothetical protein
VLSNRPDIDHITYLDADLFFFDSTDALFRESAGASVIIIEHRFTPALQHLEINGRFCVEWVGFRRDDNGMACLRRWREQCIEWCYHRLEADRMGDQKYLDQWPERYAGVHILAHLGAGVAPWNFSQYRFGLNAAGAETVNGQPLIFYHFHQIQMLTNGQFDRLSAAYTADGAEPERVYKRYEEALMQELARIRQVAPDFSAGFKPALRVKSQRAVQRLFPAFLKSALKRFIKAV